MFGFMLAGWAFASISDLGPTVAQVTGQYIDGRPVPCQHFWSWCNCGQRLAANVSIHIGGPVFCHYFWSWSNRGQGLADKCNNHCWPVNVSIFVGWPVVCQYLLSWSAQPWPKIGRPMYRSVLAGLSSTSVSDLGSTAAQDCRPAMSVSTYVGKPLFCQYHSNLGQTVI